MLLVRLLFVSGQTFDNSCTFIYWIFGKNRNNPCHFVAEVIADAKIIF